MGDELYKEIETYLGGDMSPEVMLRFEERIQGSEVLKKEVDLYDDLNHYLGKKRLNKDVPNNEYTKTLNDFLESEEAKAVREKLDAAKKKYYHKKNFFNRNRHVFTASAAVILLMIVMRITVFPSNQSIDALYAEYYNANDLPSLVKRGDSQSDLYNGVLSFQNKSYKEALVNFETYENTSTEINTLMFLYKGMSYLELNENDKAIKAFKVVSNSNQLDSSRGFWFEVLVYLKLEDKLKVKEALEKVISNPSNFKFKEAKELLNDLR